MTMIKSTIRMTLGIALVLSATTVFSKNHKKIDTGRLVAKCVPGQSCWPSDAQWKRLAKSLTSPSDLLVPTSPWTKEKVDAALSICKAIPSDCVSAYEKYLKNPYYLQSLPGGTTAQGWFDAWSPHFNSETRVVAVETAQDIQKAVNFARQHHLRVIVKGAGHDAMGRSSANSPAEANSLIIWTRKMQGVAYHDPNDVKTAFIPKGAPVGTKPTAAVTVKAGARWLSVYQILDSLKSPQLVLGGSCTTVGASGGYTLGGGLSLWTKEYGTTAANLLQAKIVIANGKLLTVNKYRHPDLFWAVRGGGPGFGVVTQMTYRTYPMLSHIDRMNGNIVAKDDDAYKRLIQALLITMNRHMLDGRWGDGAIMWDFLEVIPSHSVLRS